MVDFSARPLLLSSLHFLSTPVRILTHARTHLAGLIALLFATVIGLYFAPGLTLGLAALSLASFALKVVVFKTNTPCYETPHSVLEDFRLCCRLPRTKDRNEQIPILRALLEFDLRTGPERLTVLNLLRVLEAKQDLSTLVRERESLEVQLENAGTIAAMRLEIFSELVEATIAGRSLS